MRQLLKTFGDKNALHPLNGCSNFDQTRLTWSDFRTWFHLVRLLLKKFLTQKPSCDF